MLFFNKNKTKHLFLKAQINATNETTLSGVLLYQHFCLICDKYQNQLKNLIYFWLIKMIN